MEFTSFLSLLAVCAPLVHPDTASALVAAESSFNRFAIGVVGGRLERQPRGLAEALATARRLTDQGWNFSVGLGQINVGNFSRLGLDLTTAFDPCQNLAAMQTVLCECYERAGSEGTSGQISLRRALSCYYSGNFKTGLRDGYVRRVATRVPIPSLGISPVALQPNTKDPS